MALPPLRADIDQSKAIVGRAFDALLATLPSPSGAPGALLKQRVGDVRANFISMLRRLTLADALLLAFQAARQANGTLIGMEAVLAILLAEEPKSELATLVRQTCVVYLLGQMARIASTTTFKSREDAVAMITRSRAWFEEANVVAADDMDSEDYATITSLSAALATYLANIARPMRQVVNYDLPEPLPALAISQRIYRTGERADELIDENKVYHPAFVRPHVRAFSS